MAYRELAEKYAKQLGESNRRILELEAAVAESESRFEAATVKDAKCGLNNIGETVKLQRQLIAANARMAELEKAVNDANTGAQAQTTALRHQLNHEVYKYNDLQAVLADVQAQLATFDNEANESDPAAAEELENLKRQLKVANAGKTRYRNEAEKLKSEQLTKNRSIGARRNGGNVQEKLDRERAVKVELGIKDDEIKQLKGHLATAQNELVSLRVLFDRERKRRSDAEALLGPDGKRCKKCNPLVVDLDYSDDEGIVVAAQASGV